MKPAPLHLSSVLKYHNLAVISLTIALFSTVMLVVTAKTGIHLKPLMAPIMLGGMVLSVILFMIEYEFAEKNQNRIISWAKEAYGIVLSDNEAVNLYKYSLTEYREGENMIQLCLIERNDIFFLYSTTAIKFLKGNQ